MTSEKKTVAKSTCGRPALSPPEVITSMSRAKTTSPEAKAVICERIAQDIQGEGGCFSGFVELTNRVNFSVRFRSRSLSPSPIACVPMNSTGPRYLLPLMLKRHDNRFLKHETQTPTVTHLSPTWPQTPNYIASTLIVRHPQPPELFLNQISHDSFIVSCN